MGASGAPEGVPLCISIVRTLKHRASATSVRQRTPPSMATSDSPGRRRQYGLFCGRFTGNRNGIEESRRASNGELGGSAGNIRKVEAGRFGETLPRRVLPLTIQYLDRKVGFVGTRAVGALTPPQREHMVGIGASIPHGNDELILHGVVTGAGEIVRPNRDRRNPCRRRQYPKQYVDRISHCQTSIRPALQPFNFVILQKGGSHLRGVYCESTAQPPGLHT